MKKRFSIIFIFFVYIYSEAWAITDDTNGMKSAESRYFQTLSHNWKRNTRRTGEADGKILFPDDEPNTSGNAASAYRPIGPVTVCQNSTFCEYAPNYPADFIKNAIRTRNDLKYLATENEATEIGERFAGATDKTIETDDIWNDEPLCPTIKKTVYPRSAENKQKQWVFVVNNDEFPQGVRIETCMSENGSCKIIDGFSVAYKTACRQKYIYRELAAVSQNGHIRPDLFRFPSSCCCHVKYIGDSLIRMGLGNAPRSKTPLKNEH